MHARAAAAAPHPLCSPVCGGTGCDAELCLLNFKLLMQGMVQYRVGTLLYVVLLLCRGHVRAVHDGRISRFQRLL